jgi:hypothetical protein
MIFLHRGHEGFGGFVDSVRLEKNLRRAAPDHHGPRNFAFLLEFLNVVPDLQRQLVFVAALLHVRAGEFLHVILIEGGLHRANLAQKFLHFGQMLGAQDRCVLGGFVRAVRKNIPPAKHDVLKRRKRHEILDRRGAPFGPLPEADGSQLRQGADRQRLLSADQIHSGHEGCGDRTHADGEDS